MQRHITKYLQAKSYHKTKGSYDISHKLECELHWKKISFIFLLLSISYWNHMPYNKKIIPKAPKSIWHFKLCKGEAQSNGLWYESKISGQQASISMLLLCGLWATNMQQSEEGCPPPAFNNLIYRVSKVLRYCYQCLEFSGVLYKLYKDKPKSWCSHLYEKKKKGTHAVGIVK